MTLKGVGATEKKMQKQENLVGKSRSRFGTVKIEQRPALRSIVEAPVRATKRFVVSLLNAGLVANVFFFS